MYLYTYLLKVGGKRMEPCAEDLLEVLQADVGCPYLSDLRLCPLARRRLCRTLSLLPPERFSNGQRMEANAYLTGKSCRGSSEYLRRRLIRDLRENAEGKDS